MSKILATDRELKALKPTNKSYVCSLGGGLSIRIYPSGKKVFLYRYTLIGQGQKWCTLGDYPQVSLSEARKLKEESSLKVKEGIDLNLEKKTQITNRIAELTVQEAFEDFQQAYLFKQQKESTAKENIRKFKKDILPIIGQMKIKNVEKSHLVKILDQIIERNSPISAKRTLSALKIFFRICEERGSISHDPAIGIRKGSIGGKEKAKERYLSKEEIRVFWEKIDTASFSRQIQLILQLLLLTGQRLGEVCNAEWEEINFTQKTWSIPAHKTKTDQKHLVHLAPWSIEILEELRSLSGNSRFIVQSPQTIEIEKPITNRAVDRALKRNLDHFGFSESFTPHDLRRSFTTQLNENGTAAEVVEKILNHKLQGVMAVYNRAEHLDKRREALNQWAEWNKQNLASENVISIQRKIKES